MTDWDSRILQYWAAELGANEAAFTQYGVTVLATQDRPDVLVVYACDDARIVLVPRRFAARLAAAPGVATPDALGHWLGMTLEPRWSDMIAYATTPVPETDVPGPTRPLTHRDTAAFDRLREACTSHERALAQITLDDPLVVGCFDGATLVGVASTLDINADIADIGVLTHPEWRGRGIAVGLTVMLRNTVVKRGRVAQYTTMVSNHGSVRTAQKAGFAVFLQEQGYTIRDTHA